MCRQLSLNRFEPRLTVAGSQHSVWRAVEYSRTGSALQARLGPGRAAIQRCRTAKASETATTRSSCLGSVVLSSAGPAQSCGAVGSIVVSDSLVVQQYWSPEVAAACHLDRRSFAFVQRSRPSTFELRAERLLAERRSTCSDELAVKRGRHYKLDHGLDSNKVRLRLRFELGFRCSVAANRYF